MNPKKSFERWTDRKLDGRSFPPYAGSGPGGVGGVGRVGSKLCAF